MVTSVVLLKKDRISLIGTGKAVGGPQVKTEEAKDPLHEAAKKPRTGAVFVSVALGTVDRSRSYQCPNSTKNFNCPSVTFANSLA